MSLTKFNANVNIIQSLSDKPTQEASQLKSEFDKGSNLIKTYINETLTGEIETLVSTSVAAGKVGIDNNLTSTSTTKALSAYQGKVLKDTIDANKITVNNTLTSTSTAYALSAYQGKVLKDTVDTKQKAITSGTSAPSGGSNGDIYIQYFN